MKEIHRKVLQLREQEKSLSSISVETGLAKATISWVISKPKLEQLLAVPDRLEGVRPGLQVVVDHVVVLQERLELSRLLSAGT